MLLPESWTGREPWRKVVANGVLCVLLVVVALMIFPHVPGISGFYGRPEETVVDSIPPTFSGELVSKTFDYEYGKLHMLSSGSPEATTQLFVLHGQDKKTQNATHWQPIDGLFEQMGTFHLIDLPSYGLSETKIIQSLPQQVHPIAMEAILNETGVLDRPDQEVVMVARSWGVEVVMQYLKKYGKAHPNLIKKYIFIAPAPHPSSIPPDAAEFKGVMLFGDGDPVVPESYRDILHKEYFTGMDFVSLRHLKSHMPETVRPGDVSKEILKWWQKNSSS